MHCTGVNVFEFFHDKVFLPESVEIKTTLKKSKKIREILKIRFPLFFSISPLTFLNFFLVYFIKFPNITTLMLMPCQF